LFILFRKHVTNYSNISVDNYLSDAIKYCKIVQNDLKGSLLLE